MGANAEEAKAAYTRREFAHRNSIVLKEARESRFWLRLVSAHDLGPKPLVEPLLQEANELIGIYTVAVRRARRPIGESET